MQIYLHIFFNFFHLPYLPLNLTMQSYNFFLTFAIDKRKKMKIFYPHLKTIYETDSVSQSLGNSNSSPHRYPHTAYKTHSPPYYTIQYKGW